MKITAEFHEGKLYLLYQNEVENIALETIGDHHGIYFDSIPIGNGLYLKFNREGPFYGWEILSSKGDERE